MTDQEAMQAIETTRVMLDGYLCARGNYMPTVEYMAWRESIARAMGYIEGRLEMSGPTVIPHS